MQKKLLAVAISSALLSTSVSAVELYKDDKNSVSLGGHISAGIAGSEQGDTEVNSVSPRINLEVTRDIGNGFTVDMKGEWGVNFLDGGESTFSTRLGYIGLTHDDYGRTAVGTQWSPYYDVAGVTDLPIAFANDFLYADQGNIGTARADKMVSYRKGFDFADAGSLNFGLGWQGAHSENDSDIVGLTGYGNRVQASASYSVMGASLGYAYNTGSARINGKSEDATTQAISASYGNYGKGFYGAVVYAQNENVVDSSTSKLTEDSIYDKTGNVEVLAAYALPNSLNIIVNYEATEDKSAGGVGTLSSQAALQFEYNIQKDLVGYAGYQVDLGSDLAGYKEDNQWMLGARFFL